MIQKKKFSDAIAANISVVGGLLPRANSMTDGLMTKSIYKKSCALIVNANKKLKISKRSAYVEYIFELVGRSTYEDFIHLIIKHANKKITIEKGIYNVAADDRIGYKFYTDDTYLYILSGSNACSIRLVETTSDESIIYETMSDTNVSGLTQIIIQ